MPDLKKRLDTARIEKSPARFLKESLFLSLVFSFAIAIIVLFFSSFFGASPVIGLIFFIIFFLFIFYSNLSRPVFAAIKAEKYIDGEIVSMIRFLILEIRTERSLFHALKNTSKNFNLIGIYFDEIIDRVEMGKTLEQSLNEAVDRCPSVHLRNVYWQLLNSLQTGADITQSLSVLLEDVVEEQKIKIQEYGRELNAFSLFYMMIAIIIPTVGFTILTAMLTFAGFNITLPILIFTWFVMSIAQVFFLMMVSSRRPAVEAY